MSQWLFAQNAINVSIASPSNYALKEQHEEVENNYYLVDNVENLSQLDMATLIEQEFVRNVENYYVSEDRTVTRIIYGEMKNAFEVGTKPALMVLDTGGAMMFDAQGQVMSSFRNSEARELLDLDELYAPLVYSTNDEILKLENEGATVTDLGAGKLRIEKDGDKMTLKQNRLYSEMSFYGEDGDLQGKQFTIMEELPNGKTVMKSRKSIHYVTLPSGACAEFVQKTIYKNYVFDDHRVGNRSKRMKTSTLKEKFVVSPNPIDDVIFVDYAQVFDDSEQLDFSIYSIAGSLMKHLKVANSGALSIDVADLKAGVYLMKIKDDSDKRMVQKFVKL